MFIKGLPKGCMFSHFNLMALITIGSLPEMYNRTSDDIVSGHSTMAHISGINQLIMSLNNGSKLILHLKFDYNMFLAALEKHQITALSASASVFIKLIKSGTHYDIRSLKVIN
jgi:acyl-coenzyme A synthetase/AMP-(fatty) acid ligase